MADPKQSDDGDPKGLMDVDGRLKEKVEVEAADETLRPRWSTLGPIGPAMIVVVAGLIAAYTAPALEFARPWKPGDPVPFWNLLGRPFEGAAMEEKEERVQEIEELAQEVLKAEPPQPLVDRTPDEIIEVEEGDALPPYEAKPGDDAEVVQPLELFKGDELDGFFAKLARSDAAIAGSITRVVHWGDSAIGVDGIPGAIRQRMQARFGDSGHGFHLMAPPNSSYRHREVEFKHNEKWRRCFIIFKCSPDGRYGLGGTTFRSKGGAQSSFRPHQERSGGRVGKFDVWYAAQPGGGKLRVQVDDGDKTVIDTRADALEDRWHAIELEDGDHTLTVRAAGEGEVRLYGVTMERALPGVVWDGMAQIGAFTNRMLELDADHLKAQLDHREADLTVFMFGGNDMIRKMKMSTYEGEYREVIQHVKGARPEMDCLVMAPLDHGVRDGARIISKPVVERMVKAQRAAAEAEGCAFFDTWTAMGGDGSAGRWFKRKPRLMGGDLGHATGKGHQVIGELFYRALLAGYIDYRKRTDKGGAAKAAAGTSAAKSDAAAGEGAAADASAAGEGAAADASAAGEGAADTNAPGEGAAETNAATGDADAETTAAGEGAASASAGAPQPAPPVGDAADAAPESGANP